MRFSIITCTRNNEKWLENHLKSVNNQTFKDFEHIIIDDASDDKSIEIIKSYYVKNQTQVFSRKIRSYALKNHILGLKKAIGDIVIHLDGDDWFFDNNVLSYLDEIYNTNNCLATYGSWVDTYDNKIGACYKHPTHRSEDIRNDRHWYFTHLRTFKRFLASGINGMDLFDEDGNTNDIGADAALMTSIYEHAFRLGTVIHIEKPLVYYNSNTGSNDCVVNLNKQVNTATQILKSKYKTCNLWK